MKLTYTTPSTLSLTEISPTEHAILWVALRDFAETKPYEEGSELHNILISLRTLIGQEPTMATEWRS